MKATPIRVTKKMRSHADSLRNSALSASDPATRGVVGASRMSVPDVERLLLGVKERATIINPNGRGAELIAWVDGSIEALHTEDFLKSKGEVALAASRGDRDAMALHAEAVEITTSNLLTATSNWLPFFEERSLGEEEFPVINPDRVGMSTTLDTVGQDGGNRTVQAQVEDPTPLFCPLYMRASNWIEYPLVDAYHGSKVKDAALAQFDVARDRIWRTDELLASYLIVGGANTRLTATFVTTGDIADRDYYIMGRVHAGNLPVGNYITLAGNSTTSKFRKEALDEIIKYCTSWGKGAIQGGNFRPVEITLPSLHVTDFLGQVSLSSDANNPIVKQVFDNGASAVITYAGYTFIITGNNTLDPNAGTCYIRMDRPVGIYFDKPSLAKSLMDESPSLAQQNKGRTCEIWCEGFGMPRHWRLNMLGICYKTAV